MSMLTTFYDIESLANVFTCVSYTKKLNLLNVYFIDDDNLMSPDKLGPAKKRIIEANPILMTNGNVPPDIRFINLKREQGAIEFVREFLYNATEPWQMKKFTSSRFSTMPDGSAYRVVCDTDDDFDENLHPYILGYNSYNYDTTMLAFVFACLFDTDGAQADGAYVRLNENLTAAVIRRLNDAMFTNEFKGSMPQILKYVDDKNMYQYLLGQKRMPNMRGMSSQWNSLANNLRYGMLRTGRHLDVARLNEKQQHVGLKRLLGMLGFQILESDKLGSMRSTLTSFDEFAELVAYNVSDVIYLQELFETPVYTSAFERNKTMLETYPELRFETKFDKDGNIVGKLGGTNIVRKNRLYIDSSSQQLASRSLSPEGSLKDKPGVDLVYPHKDRCEDGVEPYDVLEASKEFFYNEVLPTLQPYAVPDAKRKFDHIYEQYKNVIGKNFNDSQCESDTYIESSPNGPRNTPGPNSYYSLKEETAGLPACIPYYGAKGIQTSCFAVFSTGGIHGAEFNIRRYEVDMQIYKERKASLDFIQSFFGADDAGAVALRNYVPKASAIIELYDDDHNLLEFPDGQPHTVSDFLKTGFTKTRAQWKELTEPQLFSTDPKDGSNKLNDRYTWTSVGIVNHEDFSSYYPSLLRKMNVFHNDQLGYDRYGEIYDNKERLGKLMRDESYTPEERRRFALDRNGVKLILNTASGAGDAKFDNPVRMNNNIIAMRIIGQLFTWRIGQAQALHGAKIVSTNTDGLYTIMSEKENNRILEEESRKIQVQIDPERMYLISKDSNNRLEFTYVKVKKRTDAVVVSIDQDGSKHYLSVPDDVTDGMVYVKTKVLSASGGTLACRRGPDVQKSLAHPAIIDWALPEYLMRIVIRQNFNVDALSQPFDRTLGRIIFDEAVSDPDTVHVLNMFQNVIASNPNSNTYYFALNLSQTELNDFLENGTVPAGLEDKVTANELPNDTDAHITFLQHYNRVFVMKHRSDQTVHLYSAAQRLPTPMMRRKREQQGMNPTRVESQAALEVLQYNGVDTAELGKTHDVIRRKITGIEPDWNMLIENRDLRVLSEKERRMLIRGLDIECYIDMLEDCYEKNWRNHIID